jgi:hypothetical protein
MASMTGCSERAWREADRSDLVEMRSNGRGWHWMRFGSVNERHLLQRRHGFPFRDAADGALDPRMTRRSGTSTRRAALSVLCGALISAAAGRIAMAAPDGIIDALDREHPRATIGSRWELIADRVMGGVSSGAIAREHVGGRPALRMRGNVSLENSGGFVQVALDLAPNGGVVDAREWAGVEIDVFGNGERYNLHLRTADVVRPWQSYRAEFVATPEWPTIRLPFVAFEPHRIDAPLDLAQLRRLGIVAIGRAFTADVVIGRLQFFR